MPRLTADQWEDIRALRETGTSFPELAKKYDISHQAIQKRAKKEGWLSGEDVQEVVRRKVAEKVAGVVAAESPQKRAQAINDEADRVGDVVRRHRADWEKHHEVFVVGGIAKNFELGKSAKICAEMLAIRQKGERIAWGLDDPNQQNVNHKSSDGSMRPVQVTVVGVRSEHSVNEK